MNEASSGNRSLVLSDAGLRRLSRFLAAASLLAALALPAAVAAVWFGADSEAIIAQAGLSGRANPGGWLYVAAGLVALMPAMLLSAALLAGRRSFLCMARGRYVARENAVHLRAFGRYVVLSSVAGLAVPTLVGLLLTADAGPGGQALIVSVGSTPLLGLLFGGMVWAIAAVMARASALAEEHAQIV